jgi:hypothetical protein
MGRLLLATPLTAHVTLFDQTTSLEDRLPFAISAGELTFAGTGH